MTEKSMHVYDCIFVDMEKKGTLINILCFFSLEINVCVVFRCCTPFVFISLLFWSPQWCSIEIINKRLNQRENLKYEIIM